MTDSQSPAPPRPRKQPKQSRSLLLVSSIQEACLTILTEEGPDKLTTQRIADMAGINIASLYQYFPNKEAVLSNVYEQEVAKVAAETATQFAHIDLLSQQSLPDTLAAIIELETSQLAHLYQINPDFYLTYRHSFDIHQRVDAVTQSLSNPSWADWFSQFLAFHRAQLRSEDIETLSFIARSSLEGNLHAALSERPDALTDASFKQQLLSLLLSYLLKP
jgi:AcrR family transcriptional regulator